MKKNKFKMLAAGLALLLAAAFAVSQQGGMAMGPGHGHHGGFGGGHELGFFGKALGLTDAQKTQIRQIIANEKSTLHPLMLQEGQAHQQMMQLVTGASFDPKNALVIASAEAQIHAQIAVEHASIMFQAYQILTPDQKTKFAQLQAKHQQWMEQHMRHQQSEQATPSQ